MTKLIGYARVSTKQQFTDRPETDLLAAGVRRDDLYTDHGVSGARASRPQFDRALDALIAGDTLVITTLDRLGRSTQNMLAFADELRGKGAGLRVLKPVAATSIPQRRWGQCCSRSWPLWRRWNTRSSANASPTPSTDARPRATTSVPATTHHRSLNPQRPPPHRNRCTCRPGRSRSRHVPDHVLPTVTHHPRRGHWLDYRRHEAITEHRQER